MDTGARYAGIQGPAATGRGPRAWEDDRACALDSSGIGEPVLRSLTGEPLRGMNDARKEGRTPRTRRAEVRGVLWCAAATRGDCGSVGLMVGGGLCALGSYNTGKEPNPFLLEGRTDLSAGHKKRASLELGNPLRSAGPPELGKEGGLE